MIRFCAAALSLVVGLACGSGDAGAAKGKAKAAAEGEAAEGPAGKAAVESKSGEKSPTRPEAMAEPAEAFATHVMGFNERLDRKLAEILAKGESPESAAEPGVVWDDDAKADFEELRTIAAEKKVESIAMLGFEFELEFGAGGKKEFHLYTVVVTEEQPKLLAFWDEHDEEWDKSSADVGEIGSLPELAAAARALEALVRSEGCTGVPLMTEEEAKAMGAETDELVEMARRSRRELEATCARIAELKTDEVRVRLDDGNARGLDAAGKAVARGRLSLRLGDGQVRVSSPRLR